MKRIIAALICVSMCCIFILPLSAVSYSGQFQITDIEVESFGYWRNGGIIDESSKISSITLSPNSSNPNSIQVVYPVSISGTYPYQLDLNVWGTWSNIDSFPDPDDTEVTSSFLTFKYVTNLKIESAPELVLRYQDKDEQIVDINYNYAVVTSGPTAYTVSYNVENVDLYRAVNESLGFVVDVYFRNRLYTDISSPLVVGFNEISYSAEYNVLPDVGDQLEIIIGNQNDIKDILNDLPDNIASQIKNIDLGTVETAAIPYDQLEDMQDIEDQLYDYSDSKVEYIGQSIDQLGSTLNNHIGKVSTGHGLFFTRVFEIDFIRDLVYISLGFGLVAFILRLGRKIQ